MLIQFTVENFLSIRGKVYFSLEASNDNNLLENLINNDFCNSVCSALIYGANASGKSNLFKAMTIALIMIRKSNSIQVTEKLPIIPFKLDVESKNKPSSFEFIFIAEDNKKYVYGFSATEDEIVEEYLYVYNSTRPTVLFDLNKTEKPKFNRTYKAKLEKAYQMNTPNKLFLATATSWNVECTKIPFEWLADSIDTCSDIDDLKGYSIQKYSGGESEEIVDFTKKFLKQADINISDIIIDAKEMELDFPYNITFNGKKFESKKRKHIEMKVITNHNVVDEKGEENEIPLTLQEESLGTQLLFFYAPYFKDVLDKGKVLFIDEIDKSLHPHLVKYLFSLFNNPEINKKGAQLIGITHETEILSHELFRNDQIYFTQKDSKTGVTELYSLDEFSIRKNENIEKGYLLGRYGAVPSIKDMVVF